MAHPTRFLALAVLTVAAIISLLLPHTSGKSTAEETDDTVSTSIDLALYDAERTPGRDRRDADHDAILRSSSSDEIAERKKRGFRLRRRSRRSGSRNRNRSSRSRRKGSIGGALTGIGSGLDVASSAMDLANTVQANNADYERDSAEDIERKKRRFRLRRRSRKSGSKNRNRSSRSRRKGSIGSGVGDALTGVASGLDFAGSAMGLANTMQANNADNENDSADETDVTE
nr:uncharacterized protein LOC105344998 isoform X2 [Crassostrea gigas]